MPLAKIGNVYIQNGQGSTYNNYNGPVQINHYAAPQIAAPRYACPQCSFKSNDSWDFADGLCLACRQVQRIERQEAELKRISAHVHGSSDDVIEGEYTVMQPARRVFSQDGYQFTHCAPSDMDSSDRAWAEVERVRLGQ
jgi:hypothetical protein